MKNFKPSELPIDTVIDDQEWGTFRKDAPGLWAELQQHCVDCQDFVYDKGPTAADEYLNGNHVETPSDEYFKDFKVLAFPAGVVDYIVKEFAIMTGSDIVLEEAIQSLKK